jgi:predicted ArsR family transcriptional regulator
MSENEERAWGQYAETVPDERAIAVFSGAEPYTTREVAEAMNVTEHTARTALDALHERGEVGRKEVRGEPATLTVWYRARTGIGETPEDADAVDVDVDALVDEMLEDVDVRGTSEMMRDWRVDAIRAAFDHLREEEAVSVGEFYETVFPAHQAGFDDPDPWWEMVRPRLRRLPGVVNPAWGDDTWRYEGQ